MKRLLRDPLIAQEERLLRPDPFKVHMNLHLTAIFQKVPEGYIGFVEELPGANTQAPTIEEARKNLAEAVTLVLEANRVLAEESIGDREVIRESLIGKVA